LRRQDPVKLCKECALKAGMERRDAELWYAPGLYLPGAKPPEPCKECGTTALCLDIDPAAPNGTCKDCGKPKERSMWARCTACQQIASKAAAAKFDAAVGADGPGIRKDIAQWARQQREALELRRKTF